MDTETNSIEYTSIKKCLDAPKPLRSDTSRSKKRNVENYQDVSIYNIFLQIKIDRNHVT